MTDAQQDPNENNETQDPNAIASEANPQSPADYTPEGEAQHLPDPQTPLEAGVADAIRASEAVADSTPVQAWDAGVRGVMNTMEQVADAPAVPERHNYGDTVVLPTGTVITVAGGIYTVVFGVLAVVTLIEVAIAELFSEGFLTTAVLVILSLIKAGLVVTFYMHLNRDSRLYWVALGLPLIIVLLSVLFLLAVPPDGSLSY